MSIHENFKDAVKSRATMAHQGQGHTHIPPHERKGLQFFISKIPTEVHSFATTLSTPRRVPVMESHRWNTVVIAIVIVNDMVQFATLGRFSTVTRGQQEEWQDQQWCEKWSLHAGLRMDGLPTLDLWDVVIEVLRSSNSTKTTTNCD